MTAATSPAIVVTGPPRWSADDDPSFDAGVPERLLTVSHDGRVTVYSGKVEYGQGIRNGFARAVAAEIGLPVELVMVVLGDTDLVPWDRATVGSASTRTVGTQLRRAAATARAEIETLAARSLGVPAEGLEIVDGAARLRDGSRQVPVAELLDDYNAEVAVADNPRLRTAGEAIAGPRIDAFERVTGAAKYARDFVVPGMLYGRVLRPPSYGARLRHLDTARAERVPGFVSVVRDDDFVGVVAETEDAAAYAVEAIRASWEENRGTASDWNLPALLKDGAGEAAVLQAEGSLDRGFDQADEVIEGVYFAPYVANAQMEPSAAVAAWEDGRLTVWCGNRGPFSERQLLARAFGITEDDVRVVTLAVGGSFGTKTPTVSLEAARLAKQVGRLVSVSYSREEEFTWSTVRPAALIEIKSGVTNDGRIVAWDYAAYHAGESPFRGRRGARIPYDVANVRVAVAATESPLRYGSYRSLGGATNHFARESHIDEIAARLEIDPLEFRLKNLSHPRFRRVLETAAYSFGWASRQQRANVGYGLALGFDAGSYVAECVELETTGRDVRVRRVTAAFDCGQVTNADGVRNQVEGSIVMGIGTALWEAVEFDGGRILNGGFSHYRVPRIADTPDIDVVLIDDSTNPPTGAGEPGIVPIAAAVANAVRDATGKRIEQLPIVPQL